MLTVKDVDNFLHRPSPSLRPARDERLTSAVRRYSKAPVSVFPSSNRTPNHCQRVTGPSQGKSKLRNQTLEILLYRKIDSQSTPKKVVAGRTDRKIKTPHKKCFSMTMVWCDEKKSGVAIVWCSLLIYSRTIVAWCNTFWCKGRACAYPRSSASAPGHDQPERGFVHGTRTVSRHRFDCDQASLGHEELTNEERLGLARASPDRSSSTNSEMFRTLGRKMLLLGTRLQASGTSRNQCASLHPVRMIQVVQTLAAYATWRDSKRVSRCSSTRRQSWLCKPLLSIPLEASTEESVGVLHTTSYAMIVQGLHKNPWALVAQTLPDESKPVVPFDCQQQCQDHFPNPAKTDFAILKLP